MRDRLATGISLTGPVATPDPPSSPDENRAIMVIHFLQERNLRILCNQKVVFPEETS
jgi:hypothetical protein